MPKFRKYTIKEILVFSQVDKKIALQGWVRTRRTSKNVHFIALNDGSTIKNIQIIADVQKVDNELLKNIHTGTSLSIAGKLVSSKGSQQSVEVLAEKIQILGQSDPEKFPLQPKKHSLEFLREIPHLRFRTNTYSAVFRIRHGISFAIHQYFHQNGFYYLHTPIIIASDAEGAGELFRVSTLEALNPPLNGKNKIDFSKDFLAKKLNLLFLANYKENLVHLHWEKFILLALLLELKILILHVI